VIQSTIIRCKVPSGDICTIQQKLQIHMREAQTNSTQHHLLTTLPQVIPEAHQLLVFYTKPTSQEGNAEHHLHHDKCSTKEANKEPGAMCCRRYVRLDGNNRLLNALLIHSSTSIGSMDNSTLRVEQHYFSLGVHRFRTRHCPQTQHIHLHRL